MNHDWSLLPPRALNSIFSYFEEKELQKIAFVCKNWYEGIQISLNLGDENEDGFFMDMDEFEEVGDDGDCGKEDEHEEMETLLEIPIQYEESKVQSVKEEDKCLRLLKSVSEVVKSLESRDPSTLTSEQKQKLESAKMSLEKLKNKGIFIDSQQDNTNEIKEAKWKALPPKALEIIFSYLSIQEIMKISEVYKPWYDQFNRFLELESVSKGKTDKEISNESQVGEKKVAAKDSGEIPPSINDKSQKLGSTATRRSLRNKSEIDLKGSATKSYNESKQTKKSEINSKKVENGSNEKSPSKPTTVNKSVNSKPQSENMVQSVGPDKNSTKIVSDKSIDSQSKVSEKKEKLSEKQDISKNPKPRDTENVPKLNVEKELKKNDNSSKIVENKEPIAQNITKGKVGNVNAKNEQPSKNEEKSEISKEAQNTKSSIKEAQNPSKNSSVNKVEEKKKPNVANKDPKIQDTTKDKVGNAKTENKVPSKSNVEKSQDSEKGKISREAQNNKSSINSKGIGASKVSSLNKANIENKDPKIQNTSKDKVGNISTENKEPSKTEDEKKDKSKTDEKIEISKEAQNTKSSSDSKGIEINKVSSLKENDEKKEENSVWCKLLAKDLKCIASFLPKEDVMHMRLVCKAWKESLEVDSDIELIEEPIEIVDLIEEEAKKLEAELLVTVINRCSSNPVTSDKDWDRLEAILNKWVLDNKTAKPLQFEKLEKYKEHRILKCADMDTKVTLSNIVSSCSKEWKHPSGLELVSKAEIPRKGPALSLREINRMLMQARKTLIRYKHHNPKNMDFRDYCEVSKAWETIDRYELLEEKKHLYKELEVEENPRKYPRAPLKKLELTDRQLDKVVDYYPKTLRIMSLLEHLKRKKHLTDEDYDIRKFGAEWLLPYKQRVLDKDLKKKEEGESTRSSSKSKKYEKKSDKKADEKKSVSSKRSSSPASDKHDKKSKTEKHSTSKNTIAVSSQKPAPKEVNKTLPRKIPDKTTIVSNTNIDWELGLPGKFMSRLVSYLPKKALAVFALVCKRWYKEAMPILRYKKKTRLDTKLGRQIQDAKLKVKAFGGRNPKTLTPAQKADLDRSRKLLEKEEIFDLETKCKKNKIKPVVSTTALGKQILVVETMSTPKLKPTHVPVTQQIPIRNPYPVPKQNQIYPRPLNPYIPQRPPINVPIQYPIGLQNVVPQANPLAPPPMYPPQSRWGSEIRLQRQPVPSNPIVAPPIRTPIKPTPPPQSPFLVPINTNNTINEKQDRLKKATEQCNLKIQALQKEGILNKPGNIPTQSTIINQQICNPNLQPIQINLDYQHKMQENKQSDRFEAPPPPKISRVEDNSKGSRFGSNSRGSGFDERSRESRFEERSRESRFDDRSRESRFDERSRESRKEERTSGSRFDNKPERNRFDEKPRENRFDERSDSSRNKRFSEDSRSSRYEESSRGRFDDTHKHRFEDQTRNIRLDQPSKERRFDEKSKGHFTFGEPPSLDNSLWIQGKSSGSSKQFTDNNLYNQPSNTYNSFKNSGTYNFSSTSNTMPESDFPRNRGFSDSRDFGSMRGNSSNEGSNEVRSTSPPKSLSSTLEAVRKRLQQQMKQSEEPANKRPHLEDEYYSQVKKEDLRVCIIDQNSINGIISKDKWEQVRSYLNRSILQHTLQNPNSPGPVFNYLGIHMERHWYQCDDQFSLSFLKETIAWMGALWPNAKLKVEDGKNVSQRARAKVWIPDPTLDLSQIMAILLCQNSMIAKSDLVVVDVDGNKSRTGQCVILEMARTAEEYIRRTGGMINFGVDQIVVRFSN